MKAPYKILSNLEYRFDLWRPGDRLLLSAEGEIEFDPADPVGSAEQLFAIFNRDDRPNGQIAHSLSVGDVVIIGELALACDHVGWETVTGPFNVADRPDAA